MSRCAYQSSSDDACAAGHSLAREIVAQRVHCRRLGDARGPHGRPQVALQPLFVDMVAMHRLAARILADGGRRKDPEPGPALGRALVLGGQRVRQIDARPLAVLLLPTVGLPHLPRGPQLRAQRPIERARQHDDAILAAFAVAHDDDLAHEIDVLDAQAYAFEQAHSGAVEQPAQQARDARAHAREQRLHLHVRQHHRDALLRHGAAEFPHPRHVDAEHLTIEKEQRAQGLAVRGRRNAALVGEHHEKGLDLHRSELARMPPSRPLHKATCPMDIGLLGA